LQAEGFLYYWAPLSLVARDQIAGSPELYGLPLGAIGGGAVTAAVVLPRPKAKIGPDRTVAAGTNLARSANNSSELSAPAGADVSLRQSWPRGAGQSHKHPPKMFIHGMRAASDRYCWASSSRDRRRQALSRCRARRASARGVGAQAPYSSHDVIQNNNLVNMSSAPTSTYTQTDEIVQNNTSDPSLAHPAQPSGWDHAVASSATPTLVPASAPSSDPAAAGSSPASSSTANVASGHDAFVVPATANGSAATHAAAGTDLLDPTTPLGAAHHSGAGAAGHHVVDTAFHGDGGAASALGDGAAATHSDMTLHHLLPTAHAHADYVWHS
jgi:hypothetical protein